MGRFDTDDFEQDVLERSRQVPVLVDFWAEWCGPCRTLGPVLERMAEGAAGRWELVKLDTERHPQVAARYEIRSIPAVKLFVDGEVIDEFVGALPEPRIREWIDRALPGPSRAVIAEARRQLADGDRADATLALAHLLSEEPDNEEAKLLLAEAVLVEEPDRAAELAGAISLGSPHGERAAALATLARLLSTASDPDAAPAGDGRESYLAAVRALGAGDFHGALDRFIELIVQDRNYLDDVGRRACLAIFNYLGEEHAETREHRMAFSNAVMS